MLEMLNYPPFFPQIYFKTIWKPLHAK